MKSDLKYNYFLLLIFVFFVFTGISDAQESQYNSTQIKLPPLQGKVQENEFHEGQSHSEEPYSGFIKDSLSGNPIPGAKIEIPDKSLSAISKADGSFNIDTSSVNGDFILSVKKNGYPPFALNLKKDDFNKPFTIFVEKNKGQLVIDNNIHHLGDNNFSQYSANAGSFMLPAEGPIFVKEFYIESYPKKGMVLKIGSIIGLDTLASNEIGQSKLSTFSSPLSIFINSVKIAEIGINSSNIIIPIPNMVLKPKSQNLIILQTGINQAFKFTNRLDYDDIEFMNLILEEK